MLRALKQIGEQASVDDLFADRYTRLDQAIGLALASEIKLRTSVRIGELVRDLDTAEPGGSGGGATVPPSGQSKRDAITEAGLSKSEAYRMQELAGPRGAHP